MLKTETGQAIVAKNQSVLHDQATANVYDVLIEMPTDIVDTDIGVEDIARVYDSLELPMVYSRNVYSMHRASKKEKDAIRRAKKKAKKTMKTYIDAAYCE